MLETIDTNLVAEAMDILRAVLFPGLLAPQPGRLLGAAPAPNPELWLARALAAIGHQCSLAIERHTPAVGSSQTSMVVPQLETACQRLREHMPTLRRDLDLDVAAALRGDPAAHDEQEIILCYPGLRALVYHRVAHELHLAGMPLVPRLINEIAHSATGIDIHPGAAIGPGCFIDHGTGVVIGGTAVLGERVTLYQGVTLGARAFPRDASGRVLKDFPRHPIIGDDVVIYAGATVLGRITVGSGSVIGGNLLVTKSLPANTRFVQTHSWAEGFADGAGI